MGPYPTRYFLPTSYSTEIGRIITRWAYLEWRLRETIYLLLRIGPKEGRIAVRSVRVDDAVTMIQDLTRLNSIVVTLDWKDLRKLLRETASYRDRLAHGVWMKHPKTKTPVIQDLSGAYVRDFPKERGKPRINPLPVKVPLAHLRKIVQMIGTLINRIDQLYLEIEAQLQP